MWHLEYISVFSVTMNKQGKSLNKKALLNKVPTRSNLIKHLNTWLAVLTFTPARCCVCVGLYSNLIRVLSLQSLTLTLNNQRNVCAFGPHRAKFLFVLTISHTFKIWLNKMLTKDQADKLKYIKIVPMSYMANFFITCWEKYYISD